MTPSSRYDFVLSRKQRALSLFAEWGWGILVAAIICCGIFATAYEHPIFAGLLVLIILLVFRGLFFGLINLFSNGQTHIEINEKGVGFGRDAATWWIFTDGIKEIRPNSWGTTTIRHHNGTYVDIPSVRMTENDRSVLFSGLKEYRAYHKLPVPKEQKC